MIVMPACWQAFFSAELCQHPCFRHTVRNLSGEKFIPHLRGHAATKGQITLGEATL
jgi:hypothetical protein